MTLGSLPIIDIALLCFLLAFVSVGFWFGLVHMVGAVIGLLAGILASGVYYRPVADFLVSHIGGNPNTVNVLTFLILTMVFTRLIGLLVGLVNKIFKIVSFIPFVKTFNRLLGAGLGLVEGLIFLGLFVYFSSRLPFGPTFELALRSSRLAPFFHLFGKLLSPLLPQAIQMIKPVIS